MKFSVNSFKTKVITGLVIAAGIPALAQADSISKEQGITMGAASVIGAVVGGPVGFAAGAILGGVLGDSVERSTKLYEKEAEMNQAQLEIDYLEDQITQLDLALTDMESEFDQLEEALVTKLEFQVLFRTGDDRLRDQDRERIAMLAQYMRRNPEVNVRLQGHTDSRGTDEYNAVLAEYRAKSVADALMARGIPGKRLTIESLGSSKATATPGDYEGYALDRHVNIQVFSDRLTATVKDTETETEPKTNDAESFALAQ